MISPTEYIKKQSEKQMETEFYGKKIYMPDEKYFSEYIECIQIDKKNAAQIFDEKENLKEQISTVICNAMITRRDDWLIKTKKRFAFGNFTKSISSVIKCLAQLCTVAKALSLYSEKFNAFIEKIVLAVYQCRFVNIWSLIALVIFYYEIIYRKLKKTRVKYAYEVCDEDIKEYCDSRGESIFDRHFFLKSDSNSSNTNNDFKIQIFKDKLSNQVNSVSIVKPLIESDDKVVMSIRFMGTLAENTLMYTILDKMINNIIFDFEILKEEYVNKSVELEFISRDYDDDLLEFLTECQGFEREEQVSHSYKFLKGFNKLRYVKKE
ncbi:hypothetical protein HANVADRAFT_53043 [Hanseniaspora valbyensis NRRL Y-1626]|uniref:Uncharacterized protein n=1 Tax=Hanseniaspora valbyensis NRRL Y-1626 TaxID=766949 RepID=A0A1B7TCY7_9ASCO|nr:hypothetical protein HANVADRAFT_53043 [Hanseniaspora valbyensis NRRL Y-1626]